MVYEVKYFDASTGRRTSRNILVRDWEHLLRYIKQHRDDQFAEIISITVKVYAVEYAD